MTSGPYDLSPDDYPDPDDQLYPLVVEFMRAGEQVDIVEISGPGVAYLDNDPGPCDVRIQLGNGEVVEIITPQPDTNNAPVHKAHWAVP